MEERKGISGDFFRVGTPQCGMITGLLGVAVAFSLIFLGFWNTLIISLFFTVGYALGAFTNKVEAVKSFINKLFPPKGE